MTVHLAARIEVDAPPEVVWSVVTDWVLQREWIPATTVHVVRGDGRSVGSRVAAFTGLADIGFLDTMEITEWLPPLRCRVRHIGRLLRGTGEFAVEPRGTNASTFVWAEDLEPPLGPLGRLALTAFRPAVEAGLRRGARPLRALCATAATATATAVRPEDS